MTRMPFGKHKDRELEHVPRPYLCWLRRQEWPGAWLMRAIDAELSDQAAASDDGSFEEVLEKWKHEKLTRHGGGTEKQVAINKAKGMTYEMVYR